MARNVFRFSGGVKMIGYVRTAPLRRGAGHALPLDLLRQHLRALRIIAAKRHNEAMYARISEFAAGYLA